jgi:DNA invertase Pin-like site-specific DNA recombinase
LLDRIEENGVRIVLIENASRFARDLIVQELGVVLMIQRGVRVLSASGEDLTETDDPARVMMRQVTAAFAQYEKERLVRKLRSARERKRSETGRCEGGKPVAPDVVVQAKRLARKSPKTGKRRSLREIAKELAALGDMSRSGQPYEPESIKRMLGRRA